MKKVNQIMNHPLFVEAMAGISQYEEDRIYCGHDFQHALDVARVGYIYVLERGLAIDKSLIYAFGLLHDIGRYKQYKYGEPHHEASKDMAGIIMVDAGFGVEDVCTVQQAILKHRQSEVLDDDDFASIMYEADKASRACYRCEAAGTCYWDNSKKNRQIEV